MAAVTWDILISTLPHRHEKLCDLLAELDRQWQPGLGVLVLRDNFALVHLDSHVKRQRLTEASGAEYVCTLDDDDWPADDYVTAIMEALGRRPDYVGFRVDITWNGQPHRRAIHSLELEWTAWGDGLTPGVVLDYDVPLLRNVTHLNPMRRDLALLADWTGSTDEQWSDAIRKTGTVRTQVMIDRVMYHYRFCREDNFATQRQPMPEPLPEIPAYPWLTVL